ncbi:Predicted dehydrogenase [Cyclobacterium lianum]|uniref:Predicted dehydrogenase n=1 Tax=Cyclobacterium lianum TaxID=388280 RepID=A0A1M7LJG7_9BACT|nr:Gfo/Idh/MocA family oxidoreductase [Cyclobacterium lianum]SHM77712.1 Predicted dehydrogenase [Cyclobacterium lianum]
MTQHKALGFGIIGTGAIAGMHAAAIGGCKDSELMAVCSSSDERAKLAAEKFKVPAYHNLDEFLAHKEIDVVCICTHSGQHLEPAIAAAKSGKHILLEKPIEVSLERADQLIRACEEAGVKLGVIFQNRLKPGYLRMKEAVQAGKIGKLLMGTAAINWYREPAYYTSSSWKGTKKGDGGAALINQGVHTIDLLLDIMGDASAVFGQVRTMVHQIEGEDLGAAVVNFKNGALGTITGGTSLYPGNPERLEIYGEKGNIILEAGKIVVWNVKGEEGLPQDGNNPGGSGASDPMAIDFKLHQGQVEDMVRAVRNNQNPMVTGSDARRSLALILGIYQSSSLNRIVQL